MCLKSEAVHFMDERFVVIFDTCKQCHFSLILKSVIKPMDLLYFAFQFYLNLRIAAFVSHSLSLGTCHYLAGGRATILGGRVIIFFLLSGGGSQFFQGFLGEGHNFFKVFLLRKLITNTLLQLVFVSYLFCPLRQSKNVQKAETKRSI